MTETAALYRHKVLFLFAIIIGLDGDELGHDPTAVPLTLR